MKPITLFVLLMLSSCTQQEDGPDRYEAEVCLVINVYYSTPLETWIGIRTSSHLAATPSIAFNIAIACRWSVQSIACYTRRILYTFLFHYFLRLAIELRPLP